MSLFGKRLLGEVIAITKSHQHKNYHLFHNHSAYFHIEINELNDDRKTVSTVDVKFIFGFFDFFKKTNPIRYNENKHIVDTLELFPPRVGDKVIIGNSQSTCNEFRVIELIEDDNIGNLTYKDIGTISHTDIKLGDLKWH